MADTKIDVSVSSDLTNAIQDYSVSSETTDASSESKETIWFNDKAEQYLGYYKKIPELRSVIDAKATWTVGKGFKADDETTLLLDTIKGFGKDTFNTILENLARDKEIYGDAFAEIIRDEEGILTNVKPLDPAVINIVVDNAGMILRYEQRSKTKGKEPIKIDVDKILHIARNRVADEIHGTSLIESLEWIILAKNEVQNIFKVVMQRHIKPVMIFHLDTDDTSEIATFKAKMDKAYAEGENMYIPKDVVVPEILSVAPNATLNPMSWLEYLNNQFYQSGGVPMIILGGSGEFTEASAKIAYLAFQQGVEEEQLFIEEQILSQLNLVIDLEFPASLENELLSDNKKDGPQNIDPSETTAGEGQ
jgi:hypothetical protein